MFILLFGIGSGSRQSVSTPEVDQSTVVKRVFIITVDALRYNFLDDPNLPSIPYIRWLVDNGLRTDTIVTNPTLTATNHVSISSGANSSTHGIMGNTYYDWKDNFTYSFFEDASDPYRNTTTGSYNLLSMQGYHWAPINGKKSLVVGWPYSDGKYAGQYEATVNVPFSKVGSFVDKGIAKTILDELDKDNEIALVYARFRGVDGALQSFPEGSSQVYDSIKQTDDGFKLLLKGLYERGMLNDSTIIVTGDHGMEPVLNSAFFIEDTTEFSDAVAQTGLTPLIAHDAGFSFMYFIGETNTTKAKVFADILATNPDVNMTLVNEEHEPWGMYNPVRGMNISVWYNAGVSRNFEADRTGVFAGMHGYLNNLESMKADLIMFGAGINTDATTSTQRSINITPTALELLGLPALPDATGVVMTDYINNQLGPNGDDIFSTSTTTTTSSSSTPTTTSTSTSTTNETSTSSTTESSTTEDTPLLISSLIAGFSIVLLVNLIKKSKKYN